MSTILRTAATVDDSWYCWPGRVDWPSYEGLLRLRGESSVPRIVYLDGRVVFVTPSQPHEERKERIGYLIHEVVTNLRIPHRATASTTWKREADRAGVEGDLTYYFGSMDRIRGKPKADLTQDPPPDLAVEVVYSHDASQALEVYRRLGVPEVWVSTERGFKILILAEVGEGGSKYEGVSHSVALPMLSAEDIDEWIGRPAPDDDLTEWSLSLREWVIETLARRPA